MSTARATVVLALTPLSERQIEPLLFDTSEQEPLGLLASVLIATELQRVVEQHKPDAVLLSPGLSGVSRAHCQALRTLGVRVIGLALDEREHDELAALGVDQTLECSVSRAELLAAIRSKTQATPAAAVLSTPETPTLPGDREQGERDPRRGSVLAVIGSKGAPGASECAASLAALAENRWPVLLAELDALGPTLAVRLGKDAGSGSMLGLLRATTQADPSSVGELLEHWLIQREGWPRVLLGAPDPQALCAVARPGAISGALTALARTYPLVVCDVGFALTDSMLPAAQVHREALLAADAVLIALGASETQLHHGLMQLAAILQLGVPPTRLRVALAGTGAPGQAGEGTVTRTIAQRLAEHELSLDALLPWDARALARARRTGMPLALARRRGPYARAIKRLLDELFLPTGPAQARTRKLRLPIPRQPQHAEPQQAVEQEEVALPWRN